jgi:hypothetical protein
MYKPEIIPKESEHECEQGATAYARMMEHEQCDACGFDGLRYDNTELLAALRALGPQWRALLTGAGPELRERPAPEVWSAIEYAAHSRDITALHVFGVQQALTIDEPSLPEIADDLVDAAAVGYGGADPRAVVDALEEEANRLAQLAADAGPDAWSRGLTIGDSRIDVHRLLEHALHDALHHIDDVRRGLVELRG